MKEEKMLRKRFSKPYHFLNKAGNHPFQCLAIIFQNFHLDDFRSEIHLWQQLALTNDQSAYDDGDEREDLMDFIQELLKLVEAFYIISEKRNQRKKDKGLEGLSKKTKKMLAKMNTPVLLTSEEKASPNLVVKHFCKTFRNTYAKIELLDLLDAVITYDGEKDVYKGSLMLFYQHMDYLIGLAYLMKKTEKIDSG